MTVQQFLIPDIEPLAPTDTVGHAIYRFADLDVAHLPVVDAEGKLVALVSEAEVLELPDAEATLGTISGLGAISVGPEVHVFEAATLMAAHGLSVLPVADADADYLGLIGRTSVFEQFATDLSTSRPGTILVLEVMPRDYSLSRLSHLIEQSGGKVLSATARTPHTAGGDPSPLLRVTLKLNVTDTARIRHVLEHEGYHIDAVYNEDETEDDISLRIQEFMRYLEV
jgi:CBS domain-containing protein